MQFYTIQELEKMQTLTAQEVEQCFIFLTKLIIHDDHNEARDYCHELMRIIFNDYEERNARQRMLSL